MGIGELHEFRKTGRFDAEPKVALPPVVDANQASLIWALYFKYGLGEFTNWLSMKKDRIERDKVVAALRFQLARKAAVNTIKNYRERINEIEELLAEADGDRLLPEDTTIPTESPAPRRADKAG
jgi:hypothetical protein